MMKRALNYAAAVSALLCLLLHGIWMFCPLSTSFNLGPNWQISPGGGDIQISHKPALGPIDRIRWHRFGVTYWYDPAFGPDRWELTVPLSVPIILTLICPIIWGWTNLYRRQLIAQKRIAARQPQS